MASDAEIQQLIESLTDTNLVSNEITFVNGVWDKIQQHRTSRKADTEQLRDSLDSLRTFQEKGSTGFLNKLRENLVFIAFKLEPEIDDMMVQFKEHDANKYYSEHGQCDEYYEQVVTTDREKFEKHYETWKKAIVRFHKLKQEDAIQKFLDEMNSSKFVNPPTRVEIFEEIQSEQQSLFQERMKIVTELDNTRPTQLTVAFVNQ
jgi:hypothetical protein